MNLPTKPGPSAKRESKSNRQAHALAIPSSASELLCSTAVFLAALLVYIWTLAPTVTLVDSGELIVAAHGLGVAHPPGFPLWLILAHLFSLIPIASIVFRIN